MAKTKVSFMNTEGALMNVKGATPVENNDFATKEFVDGIQQTLQTEINDILQKIAQVMHFAGTVSSLPTTTEGYEDGDVIAVVGEGDPNKGKEFVCYASKWYELGDETRYAIKGEIKDSDIASNANIAQSKIAGLNTILNSLNDSILEETANREVADLKIKTFIITLTEKTEEKGKYDADKTYEQIKTAFDNGQTLTVRVNSATSAELPLMNAEFENGDAGFTFGYTAMMFGEQQVTTRAIHYSHSEKNNIVTDTWADDDKIGYFLKLESNEQSPEYGSVTSNINMANNALLNVGKIHVNGESDIYIGSTQETADPNKPRLTGTVSTTPEAAFVKSGSQNDYIPLLLGAPTKGDHAATKTYVDEEIAKLNVQNRFSYDADTKTLSINV